MDKKTLIAVLDQEVEAYATFLQMNLGSRDWDAVKDWSDKIFACITTRRRLASLDDKPSTADIGKI